ncbi:hypothetical protein P167DRAFT_579780 [Morchella conica CCBAS932]|uniref:Uncharacterized protein n=1 Tax=Morchella conica CCBAS932 TaxID=1392247 RepID=A0A3N4K969_9PEZI|nr:hypothetical protein P167DRAFT_579780 [Morchella conica CCBAS932]
MDPNNLHNIHPNHPSYASRQDLDPEHQYKLSPEISPFDGGNDGVQSPAPSSFPGGHNARSVDESGEVPDMRHARAPQYYPSMLLISSIAVVLYALWYQTGIYISSPSESATYSQLHSRYQWKFPSFPQNLEEYDQSIYQGNSYDARRSEHSIQNLPGIQWNGNFFGPGSSGVHDSQQYLALWNTQRMPDRLYTYEELAIMTPIADQQPPMDLSSPPPNIGSFAATLSHSDDSRAFQRLSGYHKKKNDLQYFECFQDCRWRRLGVKGFKRRANLLVHLRNCHGQKIEKNDRHGNVRGRRIVRQRDSEARAKEYHPSQSSEASLNGLPYPTNTRLSKTEY